MKAIALLISFFCFNAFAQEPTATTTSDTLSVDASGKRQRVWVVDADSVLVLALGNKYKYTSGTTNKVTSTDLVAEGGYNFGTFEVGPSATFSNSKDDNETTDSSLYGAYIRGNFIPNIPGNDLIPYVRADYKVGSGKTTYDDSDPSTDNFTFKTRRTDLRAGVTWFPFGEILGAEAFIVNISRHVDRDIYSDFDAEGTFIYTDFKFYF